MAQKVKVEQLADAIVSTIREYTDEVSVGVAEVVDETSKECRDEIEANSPKRSGKYKKGWKVIKENKPGLTKRIIWNAKHYRLVHLLEKGHAKVGGGRVAGIPHVGPAERKYNKLLVERIEDVVRRGRR